MYAPLIYMYMYIKRVIYRADIEHKPKTIIYFFNEF